jgi:hypothetical protein
VNKETGYKRKINRSEPLHGLKEACINRFLIRPTYAARPCAAVSF